MINHLKEIYYLILQIQYIPVGYFKKLPGLVRLYLGSNLITHIEEYMFHGANLLSRIHLDSMNLTFIHLRAFANMCQLFELDVSHTLLYSVPHVPACDWKPSPEAAYSRHVEKKCHSECMIPFHCYLYN